MALITLPASPEKGVAQQYSLNTTELFSLVTESFFTDQNNLQVIEVVYISTVSNQLAAISFIPNGSATLSSMEEFALTARDSFMISAITLIDKQNGRHVVYSSDIPSVANYNIEF